METKYLPVTSLKPGRIYEEIIPDEPFKPGSENRCLVILNDPGKVLVVYLLSFGLTEKGKEFLMEPSLTKRLEDIPKEDYQGCDRRSYFNKRNSFFDKYGFEDEGIMFYDNLGHDFEDNDYVGKIYFTETDNQEINFKTPKLIHLTLTPEEHSTLLELLALSKIYKAKGESRLTIQVDHGDNEVSEISNAAACESLLDKLGIKLS